MRGKARFNNKATDIGNVDSFVVESVHTLSHAEFEDFSDSLLENYPFIAERADSLGVDEQDRCRCLLILDEDDDNGILVHSAGYDYARYSSYYPNAKMHLKNEIRQVAEAIVKGRFGDTENGSWIIGFDDIKEHFDLTVSPNNGIGTLLLEELEAQEEIGEIVATEDCLQITSYLTQIPENTTSEERLLTVFSLMGCGLEDVHLVDRDEEHELATIVELNRNTLTEQGKHDWADVLGAKVERIFEGGYGVQICVSGCDPQRLSDFSFMLAGYVPESDFNKWVNSAPEQGENDAIQRL